MTESEVKEMLLDIINNGAEYECRFEGDRGDPPFNNKEWIPYNLGEEIHIDWGYRKIEEHTKKTWLEETCEQRMKYEKDYLKEEFEHIYNSTKYGIKEVCKKILEEMKVEKDTFNISLDTYTLIQEIIKNLGIDL